MKERAPFLDAVPVRELHKKLSKERLIRTLLLAVAAYWVSVVAFGHNILESKLQTTKEQGHSEYESVYRIAQASIDLGNLVVVGALLSFAGKRNRRIQILTSMPTYSISDSDKEAGVVAEVKYLP